MKLEPIQSAERLYVKVARRIAELVNNGEVKPGEKLPSERDLAQMLKVSRPTIREAMIALELSGLIHVRTGSGIYVSQNSTPHRISVGDEGIGPFEILEMRLIVEPDACALAAERITLEQLTDLQNILAQMENRDGTPAVEDTDRRFHLAIANATENAAIVTTIEWLWALRSQSDLSSGFHRRIIDEGIYPVVDQHTEIVQALRDQDPNKARAAMLAHLTAATEAAARHFGSNASA